MQQKKSLSSIFKNTPVRCITGTIVYFASISHTILEIYLQEHQTWINKKLRKFLVPNKHAIFLTICSQEEGVEAPVPPLVVHEVATISSGALGLDDRSNKLNLLDGRVRRQNVPLAGYGGGKLEASRRWAVTWTPLPAHQLDSVCVPPDDICYSYLIRWLKKEAQQVYVANLIG